MLHKLTSGSSMSSFSASSNIQTKLHLAQVHEQRGVSSAAAFGTDLVPILSRRCSAFCAEAAVLVLVFGLLDYFMMKGRIEPTWIAGAFCVSVLLLALSIVIELSAQRWMRAHP